jgi:hypothetical protein
LLQRTKQTAAVQAQPGGLWFKRKGYQCNCGPENLANVTAEQAYDRLLASQQPCTTKKRGTTKNSCKVGCEYQFTLGWFKECPGLVEVTRSVLDHNERCKTSIVRTTITQTLRDELRTWFEADDNLTPGKAVERVRDRYLNEVMEEYRLGSLLQASNFISRGIKARTFIPGRDYFLIETDAKNIKDKVNALAGGPQAALYGLY